jgi:tetratricopeptide (TPR) repeat protein
MKELNNFIQSPYNDLIVFELANWYYGKGEYAAALSFYLRVTECSKDDLLIYNSLLKCGLCLEIQSNRITHAKGMYLHAISYLIKRPEAYFLLSRIYERNKEWQESFTIIEIALSLCDFNMDTLEDVEYIGYFGFLFEKSVVSWHIGNAEKSLELSLELVNKNLPLNYLEAIENNLKLFNLPDTTEKIDIVLQGPYTDFTNEIISTYLQLSFVNNIIVSYWENDIGKIYNSSRVLFVKNKYPQSSGIDNRNYQIVSSLSGLKLATTEYVIKMRSDQKYTKESMYKMYKFFFDNKKDDHKIFVGGIFPNLLFHPKDHLFWGKTDDLILLFDIPLESYNIMDKIKTNKNELWLYYNIFTRVETYIGAHYCANFVKEINNYLLNPQKYLWDECIEWYNVYDVSKKITPQYFKSFPKEGIDFIFPKKGWDTYPYDIQRNQYGERWHEDGY